ncbi:MAG: hypothetical protein ACYSWO_19850 [Planctomycetota bacterium]|jgi:hypothetical protein
MATKKRPVHFEFPRDEEGQFLSKELWTKKELREYERLKQKGLLANPMRKTQIKGSKTKKDLYIQPRGEDGAFLPREQWSESEKKLARKAEKKGLTVAAQLPRDSKGRFVSPTGKKSKKKKKDSKKLASVEYPYSPMVTQRPGDASGMQQGNVTVVYPPYPPPVPPAPPAPSIVQMPPQQPSLTREDIQLLMEKAAEEDRDGDGEICDECQEQLMSAVIGLQQYNEQLVEELQRRQVIGDFVPQIEEEEEELQLEEAGEEQPALVYSEAAIKENPRSRYPMYYVEPTFGDRVKGALSNLGKRPLLALLAVGAVAAIGYALYRAFKAFRLRALASVGVDIIGGTIYFPGEEAYTITDEDRLWLARSIWGEVNRDPAAWTRPDVQQGAAAVMWSYANHYITVGNKRRLYSTLGDFVQAYSQPINPRWDSATDTRCQQSPEMCTPDRLAFRNSLRAMPWTSFPPALQNLVISFAAGHVPNPVGTRTDFRASGTGYVPADALVVAGNVFGTDPSARRRPVAQVA